MARKRTVVLDLDGTLVENRWPEMGDWMPDAVWAARTLHENGLSLVLQSCRLSPVNPFTGELNDPAITEREVAKVRSKLDHAGLSFVPIWTGPGKAGGWAYVDDRAERYSGTRNGWKKVVQRLLMRNGQNVAFEE